MKPRAIEVQEAGYVDEPALYAASGRVEAVGQMGGVQPDRESDELRRLLADAPDGMFILGVNGLEFANQAFADGLGYPVALLVDPGFDWAAIIHLEDYQAAVVKIEGHLRGIESPNLHTLRILRPDGTVRYLEVSFHHLKGPALRLLGISRDVTARSLAEEALRRYNRLLQCVSVVTQILMGHTVTAPQVRESLELLAAASGADRISLQIYRFPSSRRPLDIMLRYVGALDSEVPQPFFPRWKEVFAEGKIIQSSVDALPEAEQAALKVRNIAAFLALPLFVNDELRGFLRLDRLVESRDWDEVEVANIQLVATTFASALAHREAETMLWESEQRFRRLIENAPDVIYRMSLPDGAYEYVSPAVTEIFGVTPEAMSEHPLIIRQAIHPGWRTYFENQWLRLLAGDAPPTYEYAIIHGQTGETRWLHQRNVLIRDAAGRPIAIEGIVTDMTARRYAETELRTREATLNSILRAAPIGIGLVVDRVILEVNERVCTMTGYTRDELIGQNTRMLYPTDQDYEYVGRVMYAQMEQDGTGSVETRLRQKDGTVLDVLLSSSPLESSNISAGVTLTVLELSEAKRALHDDL